MTLLQLGAIGVGLFLWGCLLLATFDRLLALLEHDWVRWSLTGLLLALPCGILAATAHAAMERALGQFPLDFMRANSVSSTWALSTLAAWAGAIQLLRWRAIQARRRQESQTPILRLEEPGARNC